MIGRPGLSLQQKHLVAILVDDAFMNFDAILEWLVESLMTIDVLGLASAGNLR
jgi:hypothetical protein